MIHFPKTQSDDIESELAHQKSLKSGKYALDSVWDQLDKDFHSKCYICEFKALSPRIEHFRPHLGGKLPELKFSWPNMMLACEHCNSIKSDSYANLIDCTKAYPDQVMKFTVSPMAKIGEQVSITKLDGTAVHDDSIDLLKEVYSGTTTCKQIGAKAIVEELIKELNDFEDLVKDYLEYDDEDDLNELIWEVNNESKFTAFKRWVVRENPQYREKLEKHFKN